MGDNNMINIEEFLDFAVNYLNRDGSNYVLFSLELPDKKCLSKKHYFISDEITSDILADRLSYDTSLDYIERKGILDNTIHFTEDSFSIIDEDYNVNKEIMKKSELESAVYRLLQLIMDEPDITNKRRLEIILNEKKNELTF